MTLKILTVFGTRPEAIKMAPLVKILQLDQRFESRVCVTAQHREMLDQVLDVFDILPNYDLNLMSSNQTLGKLCSKIIDGMETVYNQFTPDIVLVHGDTITTISVALSAYLKQIKIGHVEAGLRTGNLYSPWPEEGNRKLTGSIANIHFCPTKKAQINLINEKIDIKKTYITGNTVIDALFLAKNKIDESAELESFFKNKFKFLDADRKLILVTGHRRESFGKGFERICESLQKISVRNPDMQIVYPVHLNPNVHEPVKKFLSNLDNVFLIEPQEYLSFLYLMNKSYLILTDSGGIQEEAPSLGKPVLVMRDSTERPEAVEAGTVALVGTNVDLICDSVQKLKDDQELYNKMSFAHNPYGDGTASEKICEIICQQFI